MQRILFIWLMCFAISSAEATHIVGGQIYYSKTGTSTYRVTLNLYLDCFNGSRAAIDGDRESVIAVFDLSNNGRMRDKYYLRNPTQREVSDLNYKCVKPMPDQCVTEFSFSQNINLPPNEDGYIISYQRCCRNGIITNINTPGDVGTTSWIKIPGTKTANNNNAAYFKNLPPNFLCVNAPMVFDHSAIDPDGDSLVYELYTPFLGGANAGAQIKPDPPAGPPYFPVTWRPGYNNAVQLSGNPDLSIDRYTGQLTATPNRTGQFVVGIKVLEYRNGILIGETMRDFQFYVRQCDFEVVSAFSTPSYICDLKVQFTNLSQKATNFRWDFGDPTTDADTSREFEPTYTYPKDGDYFASLKVWTDNCEDEYKVVVRVKSQIDIGLLADTAFCESFSLDLDAGNLRATSIRWSDGTLGRRNTVNTSGWHWVDVSYGSCTQRDSILTLIDTFDIGLPDDMIFCDSVSGTLQIPDHLSNIRRLEWGTPNKDTTRSIFVNEPGFYTVQAWNDHCTDYDTIELFASSRPNIGDSLFFCNEFELQIDGGMHRSAQFVWQDGSNERYYTARTKGIYWVEIRQRNCVSRDSLLIENQVIPLDLGPDKHFCDSLFQVLNAPLEMESYKWSNNDMGASISVSEPGIYWVLVTDSSGCEKSDTIRLTKTYSPIISLGADTSICIRTEATYRLKENFREYLWSDGHTGPENRFGLQGIYWLKVTDQYGCSGSDTVEVFIDPNALPNDLFLPNAFSPNGDGLNERFPFSEPVNQPEFRVRIWSRWGEKVFDSDQSETQNWNGHYGSELMAQPEAFMYMIEYRGCDGDLRRSKGTVTLIR